jgi:sugar O-acyltransferase (sialic acid O-acetyltransferase NeuD family)
VSRLIIIGAGGHGAVVAEAADAADKWTEIIFLDDGEIAPSVVGFHFAGTVDKLDALAVENSEVVVAIGDNRRRLELCDEISGKGFEIATVIHPKACISASATIAPGTVVFAGAIVNARAKLGRSCIINTGATVDHDCVVGDGVHISPGVNVAGDVSVGDCTWLGIGSAIREGLRIGQNVIVGVGAAVVSDIVDNEKVGGVPARRLDN